MKDIKTAEKRESSSSEVRLYAPSSWNELNQDQLRYALELLVLFHNDFARIKTYMFVRFCGLKVHGITKDGWKLSYVPDGKEKRKVFYLKHNQIIGFLDNFNFIESYEDMDVRLDSICGLHAVDKHLHGVAFIDYLNAEKAYQGYLISKDEKALDGLIRILYRPGKEKQTKPEEADYLSVFLWYGFVVKRVFRREFHNLFRPAKASSEDFDIIESINAQIRALTEGDVTKEDKVMRMDCWRALTELDAKARDAKEMKAMMAKNKL